MAKCWALIADEWRCADVPAANDIDAAIYLFDATWSRLWGRRGCRRNGGIVWNKGNVNGVAVNVWPKRNLLIADLEEFVWLFFFQWHRKGLCCPLFVGFGLVWGWLGVGFEGFWSGDILIWVKGFCLGCVQCDWWIGNGIGWISEGRVWCRGLLVM